MLFFCIWCRCVQSHSVYEFNHIVQIVYLIQKKHRKRKRMLKHVFQFKHKTQYYLNLFKCFWSFLCFLAVVSLHMMPLRAISQNVRVQPNCSNNLLNIKKHKKWKRMLKHAFQFKHKTQCYQNLFECFPKHLCAFSMLFRCIWCRCVQSHRMYEFNHIVQIIYFFSIKKNKKMKTHAKACFSI